MVRNSTLRSSLGNPPAASRKIPETKFTSFFESIQTSRKVETMLLPVVMAYHIIWEDLMRKEGTREEKLRRTETVLLIFICKTVLKGASHLNRSMNIYEPFHKLCL